MATVMLNGVATWYEERGHGDPLVLLHPGGAGVDSRAMAPQLEALSQLFHVYTPEQRGTAAPPTPTAPSTTSSWPRTQIAFIEAVIGQPVHLLGCSDGAVISLTVALRRPDLVRRLALAAGVFHRDGWWTESFDGEPPEFLRTSYGELSPDGPDHYDTVVQKLAVMHTHEPSLTPEDLGQVARRTLVMGADDDEVRLEHAVAMYRSLPDAELAVVPGTSHGLLVEKPGLCNLIITEFLTTDPVTTFAPIRRATPTTT